jgi:hypothetical protein
MEIKSTGRIVGLKSYAVGQSAQCPPSRTKSRASHNSILFFVHEGGR